MKLYVISDNIDTLTGMRLSGVEGCVAHGEQAVSAALERALKDSEIAVLLLTQKAAAEAKTRLDELRLHRTMPLIASIPDRHGSDGSQSAITDYIRDAIGLKL